MARTVSSAKSLAALLNFLAFALNASIAWWLYNRGSEFYVFNVVFGGFSGVLALGNFFGYIAAKDKEQAEEMSRRIRGLY